MKSTKFLVKVIRGARAAEYVQRIDRSPIQTTIKQAQPGTGDGEIEGA